MFQDIPNNYVISFLMLVIYSLYYHVNKHNYINLNTYDKVSQSLHDRIQKWNDHDPNKFLVSKVTFYLGIVILFIYKEYENITSLKYNLWLLVGVNVGFIIIGYVYEKFIRDNFFENKILYKKKNFLEPLTAYMQFIVFMFFGLILLMLAYLLIGLIFYFLETILKVFI